MRKVALAQWIVPGLLALLAIGCGSADGNLPKLEPVSGTVTLDGKPLSGAAVGFVPIAGTAGTGASGFTGSDGTYRLKSQGGDGVPAGEYRVAVTKEVMPDGSPPPAGVSPTEAGARQIIPAKYADYDRSQLKRTVSAGGGTIDIELTRK